MLIHQVWGMGIRAEFRGTAECSSTRSGREWKGVGREVQHSCVSVDAIFSQRKDVQQNVDPPGLGGMNLDSTYSLNWTNLQEVVKGNCIRNVFYFIRNHVFLYEIIGVY
jgi:hypothetical protein